MCWLIHTHGPIEESHYAFRWLARTAKGDGLVQWNLQSEDLGHSGKVAEKHYLQVTDEHWGAAAVFRSPTGSIGVDAKTPKKTTWRPNAFLQHLQQDEP